jgi:hypothetical protein
MLKKRTSEKVRVESRDPLRLGSLRLGIRQMRFNRERQYVSGNIRHQRVTYLAYQGLTNFVRDFGHVA